MCFLKKVEKRFCLLMRTRKEFLGCHGQIKLCNRREKDMAKKTDLVKPEQSDINIITALALIRQLYLEKKISETVYSNIKKEYVPKIKNVAIRERL